MMKIGLMVMKGRILGECKQEEEILLKRKFNLRYHKPTIPFIPKFLFATLGAEAK